MDTMSASVHDRLRGDFSAVTENTYLDIASCAPLSLSVQEAIAQHLSDPQYGLDKQRGIELVEQTRALFAQLIHAQSDDITLTKNVSEGLNFIATAIDWQAGDNIVFCPALEHPNNRYLWYSLAERFDVELRVIPTQGTEYPVAKMLEAINSRTRLVTVSTVSYVPGFVTPLGPLSQACRDSNSLLLVDAAQSVGPLHTDVQAMGVDALVTTTQKGLLGVYGMGFLYVRPEWADRLRPMSLARFGVDEDRLLYKGLATEPLSLRPGARRFDLGNYNLIGATAAKHSLTLLTSVGTAAIHAHNVALARTLAEGFAALALPLCRPADQPCETHVVSLGSLQAVAGSVEFSFLYRLHQHLAEHRLRASWRNGILRFSFHLYNNNADVTRALDLTRQFLEQSNREP